jgi:low affinity Fe/Cu permease
MDSSDGRMPSQVDDRVGLFDRFASAVSAFTARGVFFALCVAIIAIWGPSYFLIRNVDTWQLWVNTGTTIITFLLVALIQNSQYRADQATQHKLNAIAAALLVVMKDVDPGNEAARGELQAAVGLEERESS